MKEFKGMQGKTIIADGAFIEIKKKMVFGGDSSKKIMVKQISSIEVKKPGMMSGYIQIAEVGSNKNKGAGAGAMQAATDENSILFTGSGKYEEALAMKSYIEELMVNASGGSQSAPSAADELKKFKELLDSGVISQEEFDAKKKQILGL